MSEIIVSVSLYINYFIQHSVFEKHDVTCIFKEVLKMVGGYDYEEQKTLHITLISTVNIPDL